MRYKINISIDDISPHPQASIKVLDNCYKLIEKFEDIKFTLFIPLAYWRTIGKTATGHALKLDKYLELCNVLRSLPSNFEIGYHGLFHGIPGISNNDEFQHLSFSEALKRFEMMKKIADNAKLEFKKYFRPPAWRMSPEAIQAARQWGIKILALSPDLYAKTTYNKADETRNDVVYYNVNPPFKLLELYEKTEVVYHACEWDKNYLSEQKTDELIKFLLEKEKDLDFCFLEGLV